MFDTCTRIQPCGIQRDGLSPYIFSRYNFISYRWYMLLTEEEIGRRNDKCYVLFFTVHFFFIILNYSNIARTTSNNTLLNPRENLNYTFRPPLLNYSNHTNKKCWCYFEIWNTIAPPVKRGVSGKCLGCRLRIDDHHNRCICTYNIVSSNCSC